MAEVYTHGMVSQLLGGGRETVSDGKLAAFFSVPAAARVTEPKGPDSLSQKKKKRKVVVSSAEEAVSSLPKKRKKVRVQTPEPKSEQARVRKRKLEQMSVSPQRVTSSEGFSPPAGIVHEALTDSGDRSGRKRQKSAVEDEESDDEHSQKGIKEDARPRRDRLKRAHEKRTVFVGNVSLTTDKKKLARLFKQFGEIDSVRFRCAPVANPTTKKRVAVITKEFHERRHNISAYVCFKEEEAAKNAVTLNGHLLDGLHLRVDSAKPAVKNLNRRSVFVGNLPFAIEEESIRSHFEDCGEIENVRVVRDRKTNLGKGFCYILFKSSDSVSLALQLKNSELEKRQLRVERCVESSHKEAKGKKMKNSGDGKRTPADPKARNKPTKNAAHKTTSKQTNGTDPHRVRRRKKMWQPTNASAPQILQSQKTALKKKRRRAEKKSRKKGKEDEVTRILGPLQQLSIKSAKSGGVGGKAKAKRMDMKGRKKGRKVVR